MKVLKPPQTFENIEGVHKIFLAGSIDMGQAVDWQSYVEKSLENTNCVLLNPRRDDWDPNWEQTVENPLFSEQVNWELDALEKADYILMYFAKDSKSPITLLELGLFARSKKIVVCCENGFWRKGNVDIVCKRYNISQVESLDDLIDSIRDVIV